MTIKMRFKILLVPEVHLLNWPLFFCLSFFFRVITCKIEKRGFPIIKNRMELLTLENFLDYEDCTLLRAEAASYWEKNIEYSFPMHRWVAKTFDMKLDMSRKAKQELTREVEKMLIMKRAANHFNKDKVDTYIIQSLKFIYLDNIGSDKEYFNHKNLKSVVFLNLFLDRCYMYIENCAHVGILLFRLLYAFLYRQRKEGISRVKYIWDGISPRELSTDHEKIFFPWIIDDKNITKEHVLFVLPKPDFQMKHFSESQAKSEGYLVSHHSKIMCYAPVTALVSCFIKTLGLIFKYFFTFKLHIESLLTAKYLIKTMNWLPLINQLRLKAYVTSGSAVFSDDPIVTYLNAKGVKTIAWYYGTNSYLFVTKNRNCDFRMPGFCTMIVQTHIVWNRHYKKYIESHNKKNHEVLVLGPLMAGNEEVMNTKKELLLDKIGFSSKMISNKSQRYISVFDVPPVTEKFKGLEMEMSDSNTEEYNHAFLYDMLKLLNEFENLCLIYKPKRSLTSGKFSYSPETKKIFESMLTNPKVAVLDYNINPWVPIAVSDMCISMPFESPGIAALHYNKPAIFHDPLNIACYHRYIAYPEITTHSYNELKTKVGGWLREDEDIRLLTDRPDINELIGFHHGTSSTDRFRQYLISL